MAGAIESCGSRSIDEPMRAPSSPPPHTHPRPHDGRGPMPRPQMAHPSPLPRAVLGSCVPTWLSNRPSEAAWLVTLSNRSSTAAASKAMSAAQPSDQLGHPLFRDLPGVLLQDLRGLPPQPVALEPRAPVPVAGPFQPRPVDDGVTDADVVVGQVGGLELRLVPAGSPPGLVHGEAAEPVHALLRYVALHLIGPGVDDRRGGPVS